MPFDAAYHRQEFRELGYTLIRNVLSPEEVVWGAEVFDRRLGPDTPTDVASKWGARRQLKTPEHYMAEFDRFADHPAVLEIVRGMIDGPFCMAHEPIPIISFPGGCCGDAMGNNWRGHVDVSDWQFKALPDRSLDDMDGTFAKLWIAFSDVPSGGGAFTVIPGSHHVIAQAVADPLQREIITSHRLKELPGLAGKKPVEVLPKAGDAYLYHPCTVHSASDNQTDVTRKVVLYNYLKVGDPLSREAMSAFVRAQFNPEHLKEMRSELRELIPVDL